MRERSINWYAVVISLLALVLGLIALASSVGYYFTDPWVSEPPRRSTGVEASPERLRRDVERLSLELSPRDCRHPVRLDRVAEWIADEMRAAGLDVSFQEYESSRGRFRNVLGRSGAGPRPQDDGSRNGAVVIGAHYDSYHEHPGANDNASGLAVLLELARTLPAHPGRPLILAAFSTKEPPCSGELMGSEVLARQLVEDRIDVSLMLSLDRVGHYNDEPGSQGYPVVGLGLIWPERGNFIAVFADRAMRDRIGDLKRAIRSTSPLPVHSLALDLTHSDHRSFRAAGLPALLVTDTGIMRRSHTHDPSGDTPDRLDYARMAQLVVGLHGFVKTSSLAGAHDKILPAHSD